MPTYPLTKFAEGSKITYKDDIAIDRAENGTTKARAYYATRKREFLAKHVYATLSDKNSIESFYDSNRLLSVTLNWIDGNAYTVLLAAAPVITPRIGGYFDIEQRMVD